MSGHQVQRRGVKLQRERRNGGQQSGATIITSSATASTRMASRSKAHKSSRSVEQLADAQIAPRKLVMRNLPANFTKDVFVQHISPIPEHTYLAFHGPDKSLANQARSRAYIGFRNDEDVTAFKEKFDGYVFLDSRGHELRCVVEIAPYQRISVQGQENADGKCGEIFNTEEFKRFIEELEKKKDVSATSSSVKVQASLAALEKSAQPETVVTPLMEYLQHQKQDEQEQHNKRGSGGGQRPLPSSRRERQRDKWGKQAAAMSSPKVTGILEKPQENREPHKLLLMKKVGENRASMSASKPPQQTHLASSSGVSQAGKPGSDTPLDKTSSLPDIGKKPIADNDRGRHFFAERSGQGREAKGYTQIQNIQKGTPTISKTTVGNNGNGGKTMVFNKSNRNPPTSSSSSRPGTSGEAAGDSNQRYKASSKESVVITGMKEFGRQMQPPATEERPTSSEVQSSLPTSTSAVGQVNGGSAAALEEGQSTPQNTTELGPEGGAGRVPNRARPTIQLYQPRGKRRYQN